MRRAPAVSRAARAMALSGGSGGARRSPVEIVANAASYVTRTQVADRSGLRAGPFGRWTDGVAAMRGDCAAFAQVSAHFLPPWRGKFASDYFHPSQDGYRDWTRALLAAIPAAAG